MNVYEENGFWYGINKKGQRITITGGFGDRYQKCVYPGENLVIFEGPGEITGNNEGIKRYSIFKIDDNGKVLPERKYIQNRIDSFCDVENGKIAVEQWDADRCYKQYYDTNGEKLDRDMKPLRTLEDERKKEREKERERTKALQEEVSTPDTSAHDVPPMSSKPKDWFTALILSILGLHWLYLGRAWKTIAFYVISTVTGLSLNNKRSLFMVSGVMLLWLGMSMLWLILGKTKDKYRNPVMLSLGHKKWVPVTYPLQGAHKVFKRIIQCVIGIPTIIYLWEPIAAVIYLLSDKNVSILDFIFPAK